MYTKLWLIIELLAAVASIQPVSFTVRNRVDFPTSNRNEKSQMFCVQFTIKTCIRNELCMRSLLLFKWCNGYYENEMIMMAWHSKQLSTEIIPKTDNHTSCCAKNTASKNRPNKKQTINNKNNGIFLKLTSSLLLKRSPTFV